MKESLLPPEKDVHYNVPHLTIPEWSVSDRPREKYLAHGGRFVSDAELIAILLRNGSKDESAVELAKKILVANDNSINRLAEMPIADLQRMNGIGTVKAITLHAAFELGRRRRAEGVEQAAKITSLDDVISLMQSKLAELDHEEFWVVYVNQANAILLDIFVHFLHRMHKGVHIDCNILSNHYSKSYMFLPCIYNSGSLPSKFVRQWLLFYRLDYHVNRLRCYFLHHKYYSTQTSKKCLKNILH